MVDAPLRSVAARAQSEQPRSPSLTRAEDTRAAPSAGRDGGTAVPRERLRGSDGGGNSRCGGGVPEDVFRYFASKEDVLDEILVNEAQAITAAFRDRPKEEPVLDAVKAAAASWLGSSGTPLPVTCSEAA